jgi:preprotein translocase subunit SecY
LSATDPGAASLLAWRPLARPRPPSRLYAHGLLPLLGANSRVTDISEPSTIRAKLTTPAIIASAVVLPFMLLELINRRGLGEGFPVALFVVMWVLPALFIVVATPIVRDLRVGARVTANPLGVVSRLAALILITWLWLAIVIDQLPCFLGVPDCD